VIAIARQFVVYIGVGLLTAFVDVGTIQGILWLGADHRIAVSAGFVLGAVFNYLCHERITFRARRSKATMTRYCILLLVNYVLTMVLVQLSVVLFDSVMLGKFAALPLVAVNGFLWGRYWVFR
jgi:putative flippase GtrA